MSSLSTHVLDTAHGCPAAGMRVCLYRLDATGARVLLTEAHTNADGRIGGGQLAAGAAAAGPYELDFFTADYFAARGVPLAVPPFLDRVTVRFALAADGGHYHVPLLVSPWSYSTYRGS